MFQTRIVRQSNVRALYASLLIHLAIIGILSRITFTGTTKRTNIQVVYAATSDRVILPSGDMSAQPVSRPENKEPKPSPSSVPRVEPNKPVAPEPIAPAEIPPDMAALVDTGLTPDLTERLLVDRLSITTGLIPNGTAAQSEFPEPLPPPIAGRADPPDPASPPVRIGGRLEVARIIKQAPPVYPAVAQTARVQGVVVIDAVITESGLLKDITVVSGHPLLVGAAIDCVRKWRYRAAKLNGIPVEAPIHIQVGFKLNFPQ